MKNILIIGATGSTGTYVTRYLSQKDYHIFATGRSTTPPQDFDEPNITYLSLDISKKDGFDVLPTVNVDCVILLAGIMPSKMAGYDPYEYIDVNVTGTLRVLEFCRQNKIPKIIFAQSHSDVSGHWDTGRLIGHDASRTLNLKGDHAIYIISKCTAVDMIEHYHLEYGIQTIILRLPTIYFYWPAATYFVDGVMQNMAFMYMINKAKLGEEIEIWGDPGKSKDIIYVKDFVRMVEGAIESKSAQGIYNVGTGIATSLEEQVKGIIDVFSDPHKKSTVIYRPDKKSQHSYLYDISRTQKDLNFKAEFSYREMLLDMKKALNYDHK